MEADCDIVRVNLVIVIAVVMAIQCCLVTGALGSYGYVKRGGKRLSRGTILIVAAGNY
jgi:uncharacterized membrane protein